MSMTAADLSILVHYAQKAREYEMKDSYAAAPQEYYLAMTKAQAELRKFSIKVSES